MREQIEGLDVAEVIACIVEVLEVAHLGGRIAGHIDDAGGPELDKLFEELRCAALARRINHHRGLCGGKRNLSKNRLGTSC